MSIKQLFIDVKEAIEANTPQIKTVRLFNNQYVNDPRESAFPYPNVMVEFSTIEWQDKTAGLKSGQITTTLHIGFESYKNEDLEIFEIIQAVFQSVEGLKSTIYSPMRRIEETQDTDHDNVIVWQQTYFIDELLDCDNYVYKDGQDITGVSVDLSVELDIDNPTVRTGDGLD